MTAPEPDHDGNGLVAPKYTVHTLHSELNSRYAREGICVGCNDSEHGTSYALIHGRAYSLNREDYVELCYVCHGYYDYHNPECPIKCACNHRGRYTHGTAYADIVREDLPLLRCAFSGCNVPFYPRRTNQIYHAKRCGAAAFRERHGIGLLRTEVDICQRESCTKPIPGTYKSTAKYCSNSCRQLAYRERRTSAESAVS